MPRKVTFGFQSQEFPKESTQGADGASIQFIDPDTNKAVLTLDGTSLPRSMPLSINQREDKTRYPGNSGATTHVMGFDYNDVPLSGEFDDSKARRKGHAVYMVGEVFKTMARGKTLKIIWGDVVIMYGRIATFEPDWDRTGRCPWHMSLSVDHIENATAALAKPFEDPGIKKGAVALLILSELQELAEAARKLIGTRGTTGFASADEQRSFYEDLISNPNGGS